MPNLMNHIWLRNFCIVLFGTSLLIIGCKTSSTNSGLRDNGETADQGDAPPGWPYPGYPLPPKEIVPKYVDNFIEPGKKASLLLANECKQYGINGDGPYYVSDKFEQTESGMPMDFRAYVRKNRMGFMHDKWHSEHTWEHRSVLPGSMERWKCNGFKRHPRQMGDPGSGLDFLAMHRLMVQDARAKFPQYAAALAGWDEVPTSVFDGSNPVPKFLKVPFDLFMLRKLNRLSDKNLADFQSEDELGQYLWNDLSKFPAPAEFRAIHFYIHLRFTDPFDDQTNLARETQNMENKYFWRLHGWIDNLWAKYRAMKRLNDRDPQYQALLSEAHAEMPHVDDDSDDQDPNTQNPNTDDSDSDQPDYEIGGSIDSAFCAQATPKTKVCIDEDHANVTIIAANGQAASYSVQKKAASTLVSGGTAHYGVANLSFIQGLTANQQVSLIIHPSGNLKLVYMTPGGWQEFGGVKFFSIGN
jgi:hypothetical protein